MEVGAGMGPFDSSLMGSDWLPIDKYGLSFAVFSYLAGSKSVSGRQSTSSFDLSIEVLTSHSYSTSILTIGLSRTA